LPGNLIDLAKLSPFLIAIGFLFDKFDIHMMIHIIGVGLAVVLAVISCRVYVRDSRPKMLLLMIAFVLLGVQQVMELFESLGFTLVNTPLPLVGIELMHAISFGAIAFLAAGVLKKA
jgi:heme A synthase